MTVADSDKQELFPIAEDLSVMGFALHATQGTASALNHNFVATSLVSRDEHGDSAMQKLESGEIGLVVCTPTRGRERVRFGFRLRRMAVERAVPVVTSLDTARALVMGLKRLRQSEPNLPMALQDI
jgi:carbamoyl-phosphate synthase large subunit